MVITGKQLLKFLIYFNIFYSLIGSYISVNRVLILVPDIILICLILYSNKRLCIKKVYRPWYLLVGSLLLTGLISFLINKASLIMFIWGLRYYFRFYIYFFLCIYSFDIGDIEEFFVFIFEKLSIFNLVMIVFQYATGRYGDQIGGMFGTISGCNAALNIYIFLQLAYTVSKTLYGNGKLRFLMYSLISAFLASAVAELKILYFEIAIILTVAILFSSMKKKIKIILICAIVMPIALNFMAYFSRNSLQFIFNIQNLLLYSNDMGYGSEDAINRLSAFEIITDQVFQNDTLKQLIGVGLGNANKINFLDISSAIYLTYSALRYDWFTHAMVFIEMGWIGIVLYEAFYGYTIVFCIKKFKMSQKLKKYYFFGIAVAALALLNSMYNNGLSIEMSGFMFFFSLAVPLIAAKQEDI